MAYDRDSDRIVLFLGSLDSTGMCDYVPGGETWAYDVDINMWTNMEPAEAPHGTMGAAMAYDVESDRMIMFGGLRGETWAYDYEANTWTEMQPEDHPRGQNWHAMAYDEQSDRVVLSGNFGHTWVYDYNRDTWEERSPPGQPSTRMGADLVYDPGSGRMIIFGGLTVTTEDPLGDTWAYHCDTDTWTELGPDTHPSERASYAAVYNAQAERVVLFGGGPDGTAYTDETWLYDPAANTWTNVTPSS